MKSLLLALLSLTTIASYAIGGVWFQEVFFLHNGQKKHGFIQCDNWVEDYVPPKDKMPFLEFYLESSYYNEDSLTIYTSLTDHSILAEHASFKMLSFHVDYNQYFRIGLNEVDFMTPGKLHKDIAYSIDLLSPVALADTVWIGNETTKSYPAGDDVGCRLEVHDYHASGHSAHLINLLGKYYLDDQHSKVAYLTQVLYRHKVIVIELCGC
jgi:hypothetical protein